MISVNIATHLARKEHLQKVVEAVLKQGTQPDVINIYLNDYPAVPKWLTNLSKEHPINTIIGKDAGGDLGAAAKFYFAGKQPSGVYITLDDDLKPSPGYVGYLADMVMRYGNAVVGFHGTRYKKHPIKSYWTDGIVNYFTNGLVKDVSVDMLGTGCMAFRIGNNPTLKDFPVRNMVDPQLSYWAKNNAVPMVCLQREPGFIREITGSQDSSIWKGVERDDRKQTAIINSINSFRRLPTPPQYPVSSLDGWSLEWSHLKYIANSIRKWDLFIELGSGKSTEFWRHCGIIAKSYEHDSAWARKAGAIHAPIKDGWYDLSAKDLRCDVLLVDGPVGGSVGLRYNLPVELISKDTRLIFVDDCHREKDMELAERISEYIGRPIKLLKGKEKIMAVI
jgi:hypothetical protein